MYYGTIDYDDLWNWIEVQKGFVVLSFDGKTTTHEYDTTLFLKDCLRNTDFFILEIRLFEERLDHQIKNMCMKVCT